MKSRLSYVPDAVAFLSLDDKLINPSNSSRRSVSIGIAGDGA